MGRGGAFWGEIEITKSPAAAHLYRNALKYFRTGEPDEAVSNNTWTSDSDARVILAPWNGPVY